MKLFLDYQHLYAAKGKEKVVKKVKKAKEVVGKTADSLAAAPASDAPTALIGKVFIFKFRY